jgi:hypothetical protein
MPVLVRRRYVANTVENNTAFREISGVGLIRVTLGKTRYYAAVNVEYRDVNTDRHPSYIQVFSPPSLAEMGYCIKDTKGRHGSLADADGDPMGVVTCDTSEAIRKVICDEKGASFPYVITVMRL